jgi:S1-C subfamily serine protease
LALGIHGHGVPIIAAGGGEQVGGRSHGVEIWRVTTGGAARRSGLRPGDVILEASGWPTPTMEALERALARPGRPRPLPLVVLRDDEIFEPLILPERPRRP